MIYFKVLVVKLMVLLVDKVKELNSLSKCEVCPGQTSRLFPVLDLARRK